MIRFLNPHSIPIVDSFLRLYSSGIIERYSDEKDVNIIFQRLADEENEYGDIMVRLGNRIFLSEKEIGRLGLSMPEIFAAMAHEIGHILFRTHPWAYDAESRADTFAAEIGLRDQMIRVIEKIIESRRFRHITSLLVQRIQFLQLLA